MDTTTLVHYSEMTAFCLFCHFIGMALAAAGTRSPKGAMLAAATLMASASPMAVGLILRAMYADVEDMPLFPSEAWTLTVGMVAALWGYLLVAARSLTERA